MKKTLLSIIMAAAVAFTTITAAGCGGRGVASNDDNTLEVYLWNAGYGTEWLTEMLEDFGKQDWVKAKYPNYNYATVINDQNSFGESRIAQGKNNTIDLFFTESVESYFGTNVLVDLTECVYNTEVPGEGILYKDKMHPDKLKDVAYSELGSDKVSYYYVPWASSIGGLIYNKTLFKELGLTAPRTTDELFELMDTVKSWNGKNPNYLDKTYTITSSQINYIGYTWPQWWAQYDGIETYENFYKGIDENGVMNSIDVLYQTGRLEALKVMEKIHKESNGYYDRSSSTRSFIEGQTHLLLRGGLIQPCGDWFSNEMKYLAEGYKALGYDDEIGMLKTPIISSITDKLDTIKTDELLRQVIDEIDEGKTSSSIAGVSQKDFDRLLEARGILYCGTGASLGVIPSDASAKELAIDFLRYFGTDRAQRIYAINTLGGRLAFKYNFKEDAPEEYNRLMSESKSTFSLQADCIDIANASNARWLPRSTKSPLVAYGSFSVMVYGTNELTAFLNGSKTAQEIWQDAITYYSENNNARWNTALSNAGMI